jgi:hypothetical protein
MVGCCFVVLKQFDKYSICLLGATKICFSPQIPSLYGKKGLSLLALKQIGISEKAGTSLLDPSAGQRNLGSSSHFPSPFSPFPFSSTTFFPIHGELTYISSLVPLSRRQIGNLCTSGAPHDLYFHGYSAGNLSNP